MKIQRALFILIAALMLPALAQAAVGRDGLTLPDLPAVTDGASDCLFTHESPGCDTEACEDLVCGVDSFCCNVGWDSICVDEAVNLCPVDATNPRATFAVTKNFSDGNDELEVQVDINCFTGVPLKQSQMIGQGETVKFVVQAFGDGELDCTVTETAVAGYEGTYIAGAGGFDFDPLGVESDTSCQFDDVNFGQQWTCFITNDPKPVAIAVTKKWVIDGEGGDYLDAHYKLVLHCDDQIVGGDQKNNGKWKKTLYKGDKNGTSDKTYTGMVYPDWDGGTSCRVEETVYDSSVDVVNGCLSGLEANINAGDSCTIVNTVFYEGIPTLSQYGMAILALLMLGMGFVGFRRFV